MSWINPKTDFTKDDYYNTEDLNRVENNTQVVSDYLNNLKYSITLESIKTDRDNSFIDFIPSINRVERNIEVLKNTFITPPGYLNSKSWSLGMAFTYLDANRLDRNLLLLYDLAQLAVKNFRYCGTYYCGEEGVIY